MKRVININFQGRVIPIEESAYDILKRYVESLNIYFSNEEGKDEIINDIESRIAELFGETLKKGSTCISDIDVEKIIDSMGRPADFEEQGAGTPVADATEQTKSRYEQNNYQQTDGPKRLYRDENAKVLGGVCSGVANYFGIDPVIVRILAVILFGIVFVPYIILWIAVPTNASTVIGASRKRLFRDMDDKILAGVCSGLSHYFGVSVWIPRVMFLLPFISFAFHFTHIAFWSFPHFLNLSFSPGSFFIYIILWLALPEAKTTADKLEMRGEKVDLNNIKNTIQTDMENFFKKAEQSGKGFSQKANQWGSEFSEKAGEWSEEFSAKMKEKGQQYSTAATASKRNKSFGDVIVMLFKAFAYFIIGIVMLAVLGTLFGMGIAFTGCMQFRDFLLNNQTENIYAWGTLILFIWVPVVGIITFFVRRLAKLKAGSKLIRYTFISLWVLGWFCAISLIASLAQSFHYNNRGAEEAITLTNPKTEKLEVTTQAHSKFWDRNRWFKFEPFAQIDEDTAYIQNVRIRIVKSLDDSFHVNMVKLAKGSSKTNADNTARKIQYNIAQKDSFLILDKGILITPELKFRNQSVVITIQVPKGKKIKINSSSSRYGEDMHLSFGYDDNDWTYDNGDDKAYEWRPDVLYIMTEKGLQRTEAAEEDTKMSDENDQQVIDEFRQKKEEMKRQLEQKKKEQQELEKELRDADSILAPKAPVKTKPNVNTSVINDSAHRGSSAASNANNSAMLRFSI